MHPCTVLCTFLSCNSIQNNRNMLESKIATAKRQGRGIWSNDGAETPAEYKRRIKANAKTRTAKSRTTAVVIDDDTNDL